MRLNNVLLKSRRRTEIATITQTAGGGDASYRQRVQDLAVRLSGEDRKIRSAWDA